MSALNHWYRKYDLNEARRQPSKRQEAAHQAQALAKLRAWYDAAPTPDAGGLLVLPTGAGKTFTAVRFLCRNPLSDGYKVLWLAHTHHLLEQALDGFGKSGNGVDQPGEMEVGLIQEPKELLRARVVSGTPGHGKIASVEAADDVVICTLQTVVRAYRERHANLRRFIDAADGKLMVVFDEAHHAPAPSYAEFLLALRQEAPKMKLLGLTATPMYNDVKRQGWLPKLFPQEILFEVSPERLIAAKVLAAPTFIPCQTRFTPKIDPGQFQRWRASYQDVPEDVITQLAENQQRNDTICKTYVDGREKFGKTIIFADRWFQCDYLREKLRANGVRADVVYSHVDAEPASVEARNRRTRDDNARVIKEFREDQLDVLINVRMLTEGTDVPKLQSVFLTRQTTSPILLRQMVGRALRGPEFGGTATANIVLFMDDWREAIVWADYEDLAGGPAGDASREQREHVPLQLLSIELIRELARQMESGEVAPASFLELLPLGWYAPEFDVELAGSEDTQHVRPLVLVYKGEKQQYDAFLQTMAGSSLARFADPGITYDGCEAHVQKFRDEFFSEGRIHGRGLGMNLFHLLRHLAQNAGAPPTFFPLQHRDEHDLTPDAKLAAAEDWGPKRTWQHLEAVYLDKRRFWPALFPTFDLFRNQFRVLVEGQIQRATGLGGTAPLGSVIAPAEELTGLEPTEEQRLEAFRYDGHRCVCCGSSRRLEADHIRSRYHGGGNDPVNLQTLCRVCNRHKDIQEMYFRNTETLLKSAPPLQFAPGFTSADLDELEQDLRRTINMFYRCAAVDEIEIKRRGVGRREWRIRLRSNNPREWFDEHLQALFDRVRAAQEGDRSGPVRSIVLEGAGGAGATRVYSDELGGRTPLATRAIRPRMAVALYWPAQVDLPNELLPADVIRVDAGKRTADVRVAVGRAARELCGVPASAIFDAACVAARGDEEDSD